MEVEILRNELKNIFKKVSFDSVDTNFGIYEEHMSRMGFFPYCNGFFKDEKSEISEKPILILGNDWGAKEDYNSLTKGKGEYDNPTFKNIKNLLTGNDDIFLSNVFMGLRVGKAKEGTFPEQYNVEYLTLCRECLKFQIENIKPKIIITLGKSSFQFLRNNFIQEKEYPFFITKFSDKKVNFNKQAVKILNQNILLIPAPHSSRKNNLQKSYSFFKEINKENKLFDLEWLSKKPK